MKRKRRIVLYIVIILIVVLIVTIVRITNGNKNVDESIINSARNVSIDENKIKYTKEDEKKFAGRWNNFKAISKETNEEVPLGDIFGSSVGQFGSYIELDEDGSFKECITPITEGLEDITGTYALRENSTGKFQMYLEYNDGRLEKLDIEQTSNTSCNLILNSNNYDYIFYFSK